MSDYLKWEDFMSFKRLISERLIALCKGSRKAVAVIILAVLVMSAFMVACDGDGTAVQHDEVVATVNGEEIYRHDFEQALEQEKMQYEMQGIDLDSEEMSDTLKEIEQHVLDNYFIIPTLVKQKAEEEGITVSEQDIEERYQEYVDAFGGEEELLEQLEAANMSYEGIKEDIANELSIQRYLDYYLDEYLAANPEEKVVAEEIEITTTDLEEQYQQLRNDYDEIKGLLEEDDPEVPVEQLEIYYELLKEQYGVLLEEDDFEAVKPQLEEEMKEQRAAQMKEEKLQRLFLEHITKLREESDIEKYI
jgi:hypothetical protein